MSESAVHRFSWIVPRNHPALAGHFPGDPLLPASALLDWIDGLAVAAFGHGLAGGITQAKFLRPARPGERLEARLIALPDGGFGFEVRSEDLPTANGRWRSEAGAPAGRR